MSSNAHVSIYYLPDEGKKNIVVGDTQDCKVVKHQVASIKKK